MRVFQNDHRDNEGLHRLYVRWALDWFDIVNPVLEELWACSNWNFTQAATALQEVKRDLILNDAAFFEAAALVEAGADTSEFYRENDLTDG